MNDKNKKLLSYLVVFYIIVILSGTTYYKYFVIEKVPTTKNLQKPNEKIDNKNNIRNIQNLDDIVVDDFSLTQLKLIFDDENQVITITGNINNLTNKEKDYKLLSSFYNEDKYLIHSKQTSTDTKIQANDTIPFFINHYYDELDTNKNEIKYYKLEIKE